MNFAFRSFLNFIYGLHNFKTHWQFAHLQEVFWRSWNVVEVLTALIASRCLHRIAVHKLLLETRTGVGSSRLPRNARWQRVVRERYEIMRITQETGSNKIGIISEEEPGYEMSTGVTSSGVLDARPCVLLEKLFGLNPWVPPASSAESANWTSSSSFGKSPTSFIAAPRISTSIDIWTKILIYNSSVVIIAYGVHLYALLNALSRSQDRFADSTKQG